MTLNGFSCALLRSRQSQSDVSCHVKKVYNHMIIVIMAASADNDIKANAHEEVIISSIKELGYDSLKPKQLKVVSDFVSGKDVFVWCLPTGSAPVSHCAKVFDKLTRDHRKPQRTSSFIVVVSPLIALMKDQVDNKKKGVRSVYVSSTDEEAKLSVLSGEF